MGGAPSFFLVPLNRLRLRLRHDMAIDVVVTLLTLLIHWGTVGGVMAATFAGLLTSMATTLAKRAFGYLDGDQYHPGVISLKF